jgi:hypothetical protein
MKRSEMIKFISNLFTIGNDLDPDTRAENLLCQLEEKGMYPPDRYSNEGDCTISEWEPENE